MPDIEELLRKAEAEGVFTDLAGKGQPLRLEDNPHADPDWQLAFHLLQSSGYTLPWLELRKEIEQQLAAARQALQQAWEWRRSSALRPDSPQLVEAEYSRALERFRAQVERINRMITDYNLQVPHERFQLRKLKLEHELEPYR